MRLSAFQIKVDHKESPQARVERVVAQVSQLAQSSDFITLPELWETGAFDLPQGQAQARSLAELHTSGWLGELAKIAAATNTWIHAGSVMEQGVGEQAGKTFNTSVVIDSAGEIAATYRKIHLFGFDAGEAVILDSGDDLVVLDTPLGRTGLATCYDIRFPELFRKLVDLGATAILVPSGWPLGRIETWNTLSQARAIENQAWFVGTNEVGSQLADDRVIELGGSSLIVDPAGKVIAQGGTDEEVLTVDIDPALPHGIRERFPILKDRKL